MGVWKKLPTEEAPNSYISSYIDIISNEGGFDGSWNAPHMRNMR
jgi:hypothetical protein